MNKTIWWMLLPVTVALAVFGVFFVLYQERMLTEATLVLAAATAAISAGALIYSPMWSKGAENAPGTLPRPGIASIVSGVLFLVAFGSVALAISGFDKASLAMVIVTLAGFVAMFVVLRAMAGAKASSKTDSRSSHIAWADRLEGIARGCGMPGLRPKLLKLAGETRFLADDAGMMPVEMNQRIAGLLDTLSETVNRGDEHGAMMQLKRLRNMFSERESEIMHLKNRA